MAPAKYKNFVLLSASLLFYFYGEPVYSVLIIFASFSGYIHGLWIDKARGSRYAKLSLVSSLCFSVGLLVYFKYTDFFIENINFVLGTHISPLRVILPIGISFYTFQIISYTVDVYRQNAKVQKRFTNFLIYVSLFPQLIAGPIVRYTTVESELAGRASSFDDIAYGIGRFIIGLSKKVIIANTVGELSGVFAEANGKTVLLYWMHAVAFMLQIYFDFSGYSDMAIGLGRIFGFRFLENFNYPYVSKNLSEFWRRWHISLGSWFKDYLYIPLGGNRVNTAKYIRNLAVVWFLTGFWHGAQWNFIVWGLYFAFFIALEKLFLQRFLDKLPSVIGHMYTLFFITVSFVIFNAGGFTESVQNLSGMFGFLDIPFSGKETIYYLKKYLVVLIIAAIGATPLTNNAVHKLKSLKKGSRTLNFLEPAAQTVLLLFVTGCLIDGSFNPFLYFRF